MPNTLQPDFVPLHVHPAEDINGLARYAFGPPTRVAEGVVSGPTRALAAFGDLDDMTITETLPTTAPRWQVTAVFSGVFRQDPDRAVAVRLDLDGTTIPSTTRPQTPGFLDSDAEIYVDATVEVAAGVPFTVKVQWSNVTGLGNATALTTQRRLELRYKPLSGT